MKENNKFNIDIFTFEELFLKNIYNNNYIYSGNQLKSRHINNKRFGIRLKIFNYAK
jgi:hypothetical protein